jgi:hypothetical protein
MKNKMGLDFFKVAAVFWVALSFTGVTFAEGNTTVTYSLSNDQLPHLFPNRADPALPAFYQTQSGIPATLEQSIRLYTRQSLKNDGLPFSKIAITTANNGTSATVSITTPVYKTLGKVKKYGPMMQKFVNAGATGWSSVLACQGAAGCWNNPAAKDWAFFLPLGLPVTKQKAVTFLNYPPNDSLCGSNYLANFTMGRWDRVMQAAGISKPILYNTIVDAHPIAAPGSNQASAISGTTSYFDAPSGYDNRMLGLLTNPPSSKASMHTLPVLVLGSPAQQVFGKLINYQGTDQPVPVSGVGTATLPGQSKPTAWIASNHPDVTTYQCCPGDTDTTHCPANSQQLIPDEITDLTSACIIQKLSKGEDPDSAKASCTTKWKNPAGHNMCVQARLDYNFTATDNNQAMACHCRYAAEQFCNSNSNNACANNSSNQPLSCATFNLQCDGSTPDRTPIKYPATNCSTTTQ